MKLLLLLALAGPEEDAIAQFKKESASPKPEIRAAAVKTLGATHGPKVLATLGDVLGRDPAPEVRVEAAKALGGFAEMAPKAAGVLVAALAASKDEIVLAAIFKALGDLKDESAAPVVNRNFEAKETPVAEAAVEAAGSIRSRTSIEPLIALLLELERSGNLSKSAASSSGLKLPGSARNESNKDSRERAKKLKSAVQKALQSITREKWTTGKDWSEWWKKSAATFKVEK